MSINILKQKYNAYILVKNTLRKLSEFYNYTVTFYSELSSITITLDFNN